MGHAPPPATTIVTAPIAPWDDRPQRVEAGGHFDLNLLEATPGIEPGIAVLQFGHVCSQASADVRSEVKYEQPEPLSAADVRQRSPALPSVMPSASSASAKTVLRTQAISGEQRP